MTIHGLKDKSQTHICMGKDFKAQLLLYLTKFLLQGLKQGNRYYVLPHAKKEVVHFLDGVIERVAKSDLQPSTYHPLLGWSCREILKWFNRHLPPHSDTHTHMHVHSQALGEGKVVLSSWPKLSGRVFKRNTWPLKFARYRSRYRNHIWKSPESMDWTAP